MKKRNKILVSWIAWKNDFIISDKKPPIINVKGPHAHLYAQGKINEDYQKHLLLYVSSGDIAEESGNRILVEHLKQTFADIILMPLELNDIICVAEIYQKCHELLKEYSEDEIEVFISPGTSAMQTVWYLIASSMSHVKLFQTRPSHFMKADSESIKEYIQIIKDDTPKYLGIIERKGLSKKGSKIIDLPSLETVYQKAEKVAVTHSVTALISGETGTGKELLARYIHESSVRKEHPFIAINCAAIGDDLLESRLFGHIKGIFTGANQDMEGAFQQAHKGTIFLDEIGDISPKMQQTLLRVLQEKAVSKVGSVKEEKVDVRVVTATHKDLFQLAEEGKFRMDLYYRLSVAELHLPSMKEFSEEERRKLISHFLEVKSKLFHRKVLLLSKEAKDFLLKHSYPGNIRELENLIERLYTFVDEKIELTDIPQRIRFPEGSISSLKLDDIESRHIRKVLGMVSGNITKASHILGIAYNTLQNKIRKYSIQ